LYKLEQSVLATATFHPLLIKLLNKNAKLLSRESVLVTNIDLMANQDTIIQSGKSMPIFTRIALAILLGIFASIKSRSGCAVKYNIDKGA
jgi:dUTPase